MKIVFLTNNTITETLINWFKENKKQNVVVIREKISFDIIKNLNSDFLISYNYKYKIPKDILDSFYSKCINLHISFLPWNRGAYPNVWSFLEGTPKGVTIHVMDENIDTGPILIQREVFIDEENETLLSSYKILHNQIQDLFIKSWEGLKNNEFEPKTQKSDFTFHSISDFNRIKHILGSEGWNISIKKLKMNYKYLIRNKEF